MINRSIPPLIHDAISFDFHLQAVNKTTLSNGIPLYWLKAGAQEVIELSLVFKAGIWHEPQAAVSQAIAALLKSGTNNKTALAINEAIEYYGASLKVSANNDWAFVNLYCLSKHLKNLLPTLKEIIVDANFSEDELNIYKRISAQQLSVNLKQCDFVANRNIDAMLFGKEYPYGRYTELADIQALESDTLKAFHKSHYTSDNCQIFVSGKFEDEGLQAIMDTFGNKDWAASHTDAQESKKFSLAPSTDKILRIENDPNSVQGAVRMARTSLRRNDPAFPELFVMNTIFGGYFGSRLMENIREEKGYTYGIHSSLISYQHAGLMMIATEAGKEVCEPTVMEIKKEMKLMRETLVSEQELLLVKNYLLGSILGDLDGPFSIMQRWKNLILNQQEEAVFYKNIEVYKNISAARVQALAQEYLNEEDFFELIVT